MAFSKVNAVYKCFDILDFMARNNDPMGITEIASAMDLNKSTVYNIINSLVDLGVLNKANNRYSFGAKLYRLGQVIDYETVLTNKVRSYLERFSQQTKLTVSLGIRSGMKLVLLERIERQGGIDVFTNRSKVRPLLDGAYGRAILSLLTDDEVEKTLKGQDLVKRTPKTVTDKKKYRSLVQEAREKGAAIEQGEFYEGIWGIAVPFYISYLGIQAVIWTIGLQLLVNDSDLHRYARLLKKVVEEVKQAFEVDSPR